MDLNIINSTFHGNLAVVQNSITLTHQKDTAGAFIFSTDQRRFFTEASFIKMFVGWEKLLEDTFCYYCGGGKSLKGNSIGCFFSPTDDEHIKSILLLFGNERYFDWSVPDKVIKISKVLFDNPNPFEMALSSYISDINDLKTIRNAAVHLSSSTSGQMDSLGIRKLNKPCVDLCVYDLLLAIDPNSTSGNTILSSYIDILITISTIIVNY